MDLNKCMRIETREKTSIDHFIGSVYYFSCTFFHGVGVDLIRLVLLGAN
jgi:hypothetical protein